MLNIYKKCLHSLSLAYINDVVNNTKTVMSASFGDAVADSQQWHELDVHFHNCVPSRTMFD